MFKDIVIADGQWNAGEDTDSTWNEMSTHIQKVIIEVFGVTRENKLNLKTLGGGMMMYKRRSVRRKNATNIYITTRVVKT
jgi:hypothetical protein